MMPAIHDGDASPWVQRVGPPLAAGEVVDRGGGTAEYWGGGVKEGAPGTQRKRDLYQNGCDHCGYFMLPPERRGEGLRPRLQFAGLFSGPELGAGSKNIDRGQRLRGLGSAASRASREYQKITRQGDEVRKRQCMRKKGAPFGGSKHPREEYCQHPCKTLGTHVIVVLRCGIQYFTI